MTIQVPDGRISREKSAASLECMILRAQMWHPRFIMGYMHCSTEARKAAVLR